jgi:hypothetical protein
LVRLRKIAEEQGREMAAELKNVRIIW